MENKTATMTLTFKIPKSLFPIYNTISLLELHNLKMDKLTYMKISLAMNINLVNLPPTNPHNQTPNLNTQPAMKQLAFKSQKTKYIS